jgi:hypothetical protein
MILAGLAIALTGGTAVCGENLSAEMVLTPADAGKSEFYPGGRDSYYPSAAFGKDTHLIVWQAGRMQEGDIVACRVGKDGKVLDEKPFAISTAEDDQERPKVAFGPSAGSGPGGVFLVVWQDLRNEKDYDVYAARVTPEGKVLDADGILVSGGAHNQCKPRLAFDGENFIVAWMDFRNGIYQVYCARVSPDGKVLDPEGTALSGKGGLNVEPAVASPGGGRSLVVMYFPGGPARDGHGGVFLQGGKPTSEQVAPHQPGAKPDFDFGSPPSYRSIAAGKNGYMVVVRGHSPAGRSGLGWNTSAVNVIIRPDGAREPLQTLTGALHRTIDPEVVWDGSCYVATWTDPTNNSSAGDMPAGAFNRVYAIRLDENGKLVTPPGQPVPVVSDRQDGRGSRCLVFTPPGRPTLVSGTMESPAQRTAMATDGEGTTLIAYEKHPDKGDVPIRIGFRIMTTK